MIRICTSGLFVLAAALASAQTLQLGTTVPPITGTTLEEQAITLPDASKGKVALLIITFSKAGGERGRGWSDVFLKDYPQDDKVTSYAIAMLEDVPSILRGMVRRGIKRGVPTSVRRRFVTVTQGEGQWKQRVGMKDDKDAYLLLLDSRGQLQWIHHGAFDPSVYASLKMKIAELVNPKTGESHAER